MHRNQEGFTLPEILIGLAISSIIIAASFASYIVIKQNYDFQKDMKKISQTSNYDIPYYITDNKKVINHLVHFIKMDF